MNGTREELLAALVVCPDCKKPFAIRREDAWYCPQDQRTVKLSEGKPIFTPTPGNAHIYEKVERGPDRGTPWRRANWRFLEAQIREQPEEALILDIGAGHGDFAPVLQGRRLLALDIVPYPEVDLVCDLSQCIPFREATFDVLLMMNLIEHVYAFHTLLDAAFYLLKPGGRLLIAVPFMIKIHQAPFDFYRYTHYALRQLAADHGFQVSLLEGYYDPIFFAGEGLRNIRFRVLPELKRPSRWFVRGLLELSEALLSLMGIIVGPGRILSPEQSRSPAAIGYHLVLVKTGKK
uniref:Hypothetical conserved protein n=1 Tax=uncultured Chloroflexota bacterium TaxID=166587 RepID=H5SBF9_9CHLR|nr:hypothetical conserved protein [uncultured Chloroflexota bacterium]